MTIEVAAIPWYYVGENLRKISELAPPSRCGRISFQLSENWLEAATCHEREAESTRASLLSVFVCDTQTFAQSFLCNSGNNKRRAPVEPAFANRSSGQIPRQQRRNQSFSLGRQSTEPIKNLAGFKKASALLTMRLPFLFVHLFGHTAHHRPARVFAQLDPCMIPDPPPVQSIPDITPLTLFMVAHLSNVR